MAQFHIGAERRVQIGQDLAHQGDAVIAERREPLEPGRADHAAGNNAGSAARESITASGFVSCMSRPR